MARVYDNESISSLKGADRVRLRPGVIFGSNGIDGCQHSFFEILSNSIDEAREGFGNKITVTRFSDHSIEVEDFGRGVPVDFNRGEDRYNWELVYCELYAGGKYDNNDRGNYEYSLGLNGLGACATQYASEFMDVTVYRDGKRYSLHFEKGENVGGLSDEPYSGKRTGTVHRWRPDRDVFNEIDIPSEYFHDIIKKQAVVNSGVTFIFKNETEGGFESTEYYYENGITDYLAELAGEDTITAPIFIEGDRRGRDRADKPEYKVKLSVALCFSNRVTALEYYHNSSFLEHGGSPDRAVKSAFVSTIDSYIKSIGKYTKNESKITFADVADCLCLISSSFSTETSYENQTKKSITNKFIYECMSEFLKSQLEVYFLENKADADRIADQVLINKRSRESAEKARVDIKKKLSGGMDMANRVQKFVSCRSKDPEKRELFIVEGDSALGACKLARDSEFQAIIPVRGKILNCLKAGYDKIFKNEIIIDLLRVLGCGVEVKTRSSRDFDFFDISKLQWSKVIICTDADVDGFQIRTLILTMFYRLIPTLIEEGRVYIAESPLFEIITKDGSVFAYSNPEKNGILESLGGKKHKVDRSKGLGQNEPDMLWQTTMNPASRRLQRVTPDDVALTEAMFDLLLGDNLQGRKDFITEHGAKYLELLDIS